MAILSQNWTSLIKPTIQVVEEKGKSSEYDKTLVVESLERGFALTLGNALRRVLLSSLQGFAITGVKVDGVLHEFSPIPGVKEDMVDVVLNLKGVVLVMESPEKKHITLSAEGPCIVTAGMIDTGHAVTVVNPDQVICTLDAGAKIKMQLTCGMGKGYSPAANNNYEDAPIGFIPIDAIFSPVASVSYKVENSRVGQVTDYDKLIMNIKTNGAVTSDMALGLADRILQDQLQVFINFEEEQIRQEESAAETLPFDKNLLKRVNELELSVRSQNCLRNDNIVYIGDLVTKSEGDMLRTPNFGRKSLNELKEVLASMGLRFGMEVKGWPPENVEELYKKYEHPFK